jgi:hypothetical protein
MSDGPGGAAAMRAVAPFAFRYQYLAGGVNTGSGWATWKCQRQLRALVHRGLDRARHHPGLHRSRHRRVPFGGGAGGTTCACNAAYDGITNPAPISANTLASESAPAGTPPAEVMARSRSAAARSPVRQQVSESSGDLERSDFLHFGL